MNHRLLDDLTEGKRLTYPIQPNPNGLFICVAAGTTVQYFAGRRLGGTWDRLESTGTYYPYREGYGTRIVNSEYFATYYRDGAVWPGSAGNRARSESVPPGKGRSD